MPLTLLNAVFAILPVVVLGVNLINQDTRHCGSGDALTCRSIAASRRCDSVPHLGIQSVKYSGFSGQLHGVLAYNEDARYKCGSEQHATIGIARSGCLVNTGYTVHGGSAWLDCKTAIDCYVYDVHGKRSGFAENAMEPDTQPVKLRRAKITESVKPDVLTTARKHHFIKGVMRCNNFPNITPMTEEQTESFLEDYRTMTGDELYNKWHQYAVESNEMTDKIVFGE